MPCDGEEIRREIVTLLPRLRRFASALTGSTDDGDDLAQATIERALQRISQWQPESRLDSWMFRIAQNLWFDQLRAQKRRGVMVSVDELHDVSGCDGRAVTESELMLRRTQQAIACLPEEQRAVVALVLVDGASYSEAASLLETPIGTVMSRLSRARKALITMLELGDKGQ